VHAQSRVQRGRLTQAAVWPRSCRVQVQTLDYVQHYAQSCQCVILYAVCFCRRFLELGGQLLEHTAFQQLSVYDDAAHLQLTAQHTAGTQHLAQAAAVATSTTGEAAAGAGGRQATFQPTTTADAVGSSLVLSCGVVVDALGSFSPLSAQARGAAAPEAAMLLVGSCVDAPQTTPAAPAAESGGRRTTTAAADVLWGMNPIDRQVTLGDRGDEGE